MQQPRHKRVDIFAANGSVAMVKGLTGDFSRMPRIGQRSAHRQLFCHGEICWRRTHWRTTVPALRPPADRDFGAARVGEFLSMLNVYGLFTAVQASSYTAPARTIRAEGGGHSNDGKSSAPQQLTCV